jgi:hydroxycarboxylate dehydrogenase B
MMPADVFSSRRCAVPIVSAAVLQSFTESLFQAAGVEAANYPIVAASLVDANMRGHD